MWRAPALAIALLMIGSCDEGDPDPSCAQWLACYDECHANAGYSGRFESGQIWACDDECVAATGYPVDGRPVTEPQQRLEGREAILSGEIVSAGIDLDGFGTPTDETALLMLQSSVWQRSACVVR